MPSIRAPAIATLLDHAYAPAPTLSCWLETLTADLAALAPGSLGAVGRIICQDEGAPPRLLCPYATAVDSGRLDRTLHAHSRQSRHRVDLVDGGRGLRDFARRCEELARDRYVQEMKARFHGTGLRNLHHLTARDDTGHVVSVGLLSSTRTRTAIPRLMWKMVGAHLESAFHLQLRFQAEQALRAPVARLGEAVPAASPTALPSAHAVWDGLVAGTWSVLARRDHAGRRYIIAVPSAATRDARGLSRREAQVAALAVQGLTDKEIAFMLGMARSTVAGYVRDALWKLGIRSRLELERAFRPSPSSDDVEAR